MTELATPRLTMRRFEPRDSAVFAALNADPAVMEFFPSVLSRFESDQIATRIQSKFDANGWGFWAVELKATGQFIGFVGLNHPGANLPCSPCTEIGWRLGRPYWGNGYATEAAHRALRFGFDVLHLPELFSFTTVNNARSRALMERLGLQNTGRNFLHPLVAAESGLQEHVLYRISRSPDG